MYAKLVIAMCVFLILCYLCFAKNMDATKASSSQSLWGDLKQNPIFWVCHYTRLHDRNRHIKNQLRDYHAEFIFEYDPENLKRSDIDRFQVLRQSEISLFLKHVCAWRRILTSSSCVNIVVEDDAVLDQNFQEMLETSLSDKSMHECEFLVLGTCLNMHIEGQGTIREKHPPEARCGHGYMISKNLCQTLLERFGSTGAISLPVDHWLNKVFVETNTRVFWQEPASIVQAGFPSTVR